MKYDFFGPIFAVAIQDTSIQEGTLIQLLLALHSTPTRLQSPQWVRIVFPIWIALVQLILRLYMNIDTNFEKLFERTQTCHGSVLLHAHVYFRSTHKSTKFTLMQY